jgi:hypothetical protein
MPNIPIRATAGYLLLLASGACAPLAAQDHHRGTQHPHMSLTPLRPGTAADSARALALVRDLRSAIAPYQTISAAAAAGYRARRDSATVPAGRLLHVGRRVRWRDLGRGFDAAAPQSLLYRRTADGSMRLAGAMFVAPWSATAEDLDAMVPLSVARWHRHIGLCLVRGAAPGPRLVLRHARSAGDCEQSGGWYRAETRYMIHVMTDAGDGLAGVFPQGR